MLSPLVYDQIEQKAHSHLPNSIIQAFSPISFKNVGYPTRINDESELFKYIDVMHDLRFEGDYENLLERITDDEFKMLQRLTSLVFDFSKKYFRRKAIARASILRSLHVLRHIKFIMLIDLTQQTAYPVENYLDREMISGLSGNVVA